NERKRGHENRRLHERRSIVGVPCGETDRARRRRGGPRRKHESAESGKRSGAARHHKYSLQERSGQSATTKYQNTPTVANASAASVTRRARNSTQPRPP